VGSWQVILASLCLSFLICKIGTVIVPVSESCFKDYMIIFGKHLEQCLTYTGHFATSAFIVLVVNIYWALFMSQELWLWHIRQNYHIKKSLLTPFHRWGICRSERPNNFHAVMQLESTRSTVWLLLCPQTSTCLSS